jgi:cold shock CspA family protein
MQVPPEISYRNVKKKEEIEALIHRRISKLEKIGRSMTGCHVTVESPHRHQSSGNPIQVRIRANLPPGQELTVRRDSSEGGREEPLQTVLRKAFEAMERRIKEWTQRQRGEVKAHPEQQAGALIERLFPDYGFLRSVDGREIYFHKNSVLHDDFGRLEIGTGVRFVEEMGEKGLQASTVEIVDKPGVRTAEE